MARSYKRHKRGGAGRHVQLFEWFMASAAWASLKPGPRLLYIELKRRYNGSNNGQIFLSHRLAALAIGVSRNTVGPYFDELQEKGFIRMTQAPYLGPSGIGQSSVWALTELATADGKLATKDFIKWRESQKPHPNSRLSRPKKQDVGGENEGSLAETVPKFVTA